MPNLSKSDLMKAIEEGYFDKGIRERAAVCYFESQLRRFNGVCGEAVKQTSNKFKVCEKTVYGYIKEYRV